MAKIDELKEAILDAVATLDDCDGSRAATIEAIDAARETLADAYGDDFENDLEEFLENQDTDGDGVDDASELADNDED